MLGTLRCTSSPLPSPWTQSFTTNEKAILEQSFRDLVRDLEKQKEEVRAALEQREQDAVDQVKVIVDALEERAKVLQDDKQTREQLHNISDSVLFLQVTSNSAAIQPLTPSIRLPKPSSSVRLSIHPCIHHSLSIHPSKLRPIYLIFHPSHPTYFKGGKQRSPCANFYQYILIVLQGIAL